VHDACRSLTLASTCSADVMNDSIGGCSSYVLPTGGPTAQVCWLGPKVGGRLALFCIHRVNRVNSRNDSATES